MAREKPDVWGCGHRLPLEVAPMGDGRRARCLRCGQCGPVHPNAEGAVRALQDLPGGRKKIGA